MGDPDEPVWHVDLEQIAALLVAAHIGFVGGCSPAATGVREVIHEGLRGRETPTQDHYDERGPPQPTPVKATHISFHTFEQKPSQIPCADTRPPMLWPSQLPATRRCTAQSVSLQGITCMRRIMESHEPVNM